MQQIHFIGIGGAGMSGIAQVLLEMGCKVSGSDLKESRNTERLKKYGAAIKIGHKADNIGDADVVVVSSAIPSKNPELKAANKEKVPVLRRAEMLARLCQGKKNIAVAGTHGKTTTTSMIARMLDTCGLDPTFLIGGELNDIGSNARFGRGEYLVAEADESDGSFLHLSPQIIVLTNIEADHLDYYGDITHIEQVFRQFADKIASDGLVVACGDCPNLRKLTDYRDGKFITYGLGEDNDLYAKNLDFPSLSSNFDVVFRGESLGQVSLTVPGIHNIYNALAAIGLGISLDLSINDIAESLRSFSGVQRRFQLIGQVSDITVVDDYAHHPTELKATLEAAEKGPWSRIVCIFQPHRFSRTRFLGSDFGDAFHSAHLSIVTDVYAAGEKPLPGVTGKVLVEAILQNNPRKSVIYLPKKSDVLGFLASHVRQGDLVLTAGAGDIWTVGEGLLDILKADTTKVHRNGFGQ